MNVLLRRDDAPVMLYVMQKATLVDRLNRIANLFQLGSPSKEESAVCDVFDATDEYPLSLIGEAREQFQSSLDDLHSSLSIVKDTISRGFLQGELIPLIREKKVRGELFGPVDAESFQQKFSNLSLQNFRVLRPIYGVDAAANLTPVVFGDFKIDFGRNVLIADGPSELLSAVLRPHHRDQLFVQCHVPARESGLAARLADKLFYRFELIFRFLIGRRTDRVEVGILNYKGAQMRDRFIYSEDGRPVGHNAAWHGALQPFLLKDERFPEATPPMSRLFGLITRKNNDLEKHILRCAEWTGQALAEPNEAAALVKAAIALEVLFSANERGVITPSIMAHISESCAFLLGSENASPLSIEREVKRLYAVRSAVVHSGKDSVDPKDLESFIKICRSAVIRLLSEFSQIDSVAKLSEHFKSKKYASVCDAQPTTPVQP